MGTKRVSHPNFFLDICGLRPQNLDMTMWSKGTRVQGCSYSSLCSLVVLVILREWKLWDAAQAPDTGPGW